MRLALIILIHIQIGRWRTRDIKPSMIAVDCHTLRIMIPYAATEDDDDKEPRRA